MSWLRCAALLCDLDGVLVDSTACVERQWRRWATARGLDAAAILAGAHGRRAVDVVRRVAPDLDAETEAEVLDRWEAADGADVVAMAGAAALLARLPPARWAIVTSCPRFLAEARLAHAGLPTPQTLVCAEDVRAGKPDPQGYLCAAQRLGVPPEACVVVEDAPAGVEAARTAGMRVIAVLTTHAAAALAAADVRVGQVGDLQVTQEDVACLTVRPVPQE